MLLVQAMILMGYIKSRVELSVPTNDWKRTWRWARLKGLGSAATSILCKLVHQLFPTEDRLARILPASDPCCKLCHTQAPADLGHCLFQRDGNKVNIPHLNSWSSYNPKKVTLNLKAMLGWHWSRSLHRLSSTCGASGALERLPTLLSQKQLWRAKSAFLEKLDSRMNLV